jgi:hypothetical protein
MRTFVVTTEGQNRLSLRELCEQYVNDQWFAAHMTDEHPAEALLGQFRRVVPGELELLRYVRLTRAASCSAVCHSDDSSGKFQSGQSTGWNSSLSTRGRDSPRFRPPSQSNHSNCTPSSWADARPRPRTT